MEELLAHSAAIEIESHRRVRVIDKSLMQAHHLTTHQQLDRQVADHIPPVEEVVATELEWENYGLDHTEGLPACSNEVRGLV